jgi:hypothetical protein
MNNISCCQEEYEKYFTFFLIFPLPAGMMHRREEE